MRQFVDTGLADELAHLGDTRVVLNLDEGILNLFLLLLVEIALGHDIVIADEHHLVVADHHVGLHTHIHHHHLGLFTKRGGDDRLLVFFGLLGILVAFFLGYLFQTLLSIDVHRTELEEVEDGVVGTHTLGLIYHRALALQTDGNGGDDKDGRQDDDAQCGEEDVKQAFPDGYLETEHPVTRSLVVEEHTLAVGNKLNLLIQFRHGGIQGYRIVDAALLIDLAVFIAEVAGEQDDIGVLALFPDIGDGSHVLVALVLLEEHNEMLIAYMGYAG